MEKLKNRNISLADLKKEIDSFIVMLGDDIDFETKFNIELYFKRKEQIQMFLESLQEKKEK